MAQELYMVGLTVRDVDKSAEFYRQLGLAIPDPNPLYPHVPVKMAGGMTFFMDPRPVPRDDPELAATLGPYKVLLEFFLPTRAEVDARYNHMIALGHRNYHAPFQTSFGLYFALVDDPDGNTVLLSSDEPLPAAE